MKTKNLKNLKKYLSLSFLIIIFLVSYLYQIISFPSKNRLFNQNDISHNYHNVSIIFKNSYFLFYNLIGYAIISVKHNPNLFLLRIPSLLVALAIVVITYRILRNWHGNYIAFVGTLLIISSAFMLHLGRIELNLINFLLIIPIILLVKILTATSISNTRLYVSLALLSMVILIPGGIFFVILFIYFSKKNLLTLVKNKINFKKIVLTILTGFYWFPLVVYSYLNNHSSYQSFIDIDIFSWRNFMHLSDILLPIKELFFSGINNQNIWLPGTPLFNGFMLIIFIFGLIYYFRNLTASRSKLLLSSLLVSYVLDIFNNNFIFLLISLVFFISITGLANLLVIWFKNFPLNKVARSVGYVLITILVLVAVYYNYRSYFIVWKYNNNTIALFDLKSKN